MHRELAIEAGGMLENVARRRETLRGEQRGARSFHDRRCRGEHLSFWRELAPVQRELRLRHRDAQRVRESRLLQPEQRGGSGRGRESQEVGALVTVPDLRCDRPAQSARYLIGYDLRAQHGGPIVPERFGHCKWYNHDCGPEVAAIVKIVELERVRI